MTHNQSTALVLGAGIQGICAALALRSRGYRVTLVDQAPAIMNRASGRNEAKIHLGFVYANDPSFRTASLMLDAALSFAPLLDAWLPAALDWPRLTSRPFLYAILPDSLLPPDQIHAFYSRVQCAYAERLDGRHYLGARPPQLWQPIASSAYPSWLNSSRVAGLIDTAEVALDLARFRQRIAAALASLDGIELLFNHRVHSAASMPSGFCVEGITTSGERWHREADILVNSLWENRLRLDAEMGLRPRRGWVYRLKYRLLGHLPATLSSLPSITFALGPYGDIVTYPAARAYLNWYPVCLAGWSDDLTPPPEWNDACRGLVPAPVAHEITQGSLAALDRIIPGVAAARVDHVDAGVIFSWGKSRVDVDDPQSELHERHAIGVHAHNGYFSIDTGKFTCAPLFAARLLDHLA